jgi:hypothetical protein
VLRFLIFFILTYLFFLFLNLFFSWRKRQRGLGARRRAKEPEEMVLDPQCQSYIPKCSAIFQRGHYICSEHSARHFLFSSNFVLGILRQIAAPGFSHDVVAHAKGICLNRQCRVQSSGSHEDAGIDDEEIGYVVGATEPVDHRPAGIIAHPAGSHLVVVEFAQAGSGDMDFRRAGRLEDLPGALP